MWDQWWFCKSTPLFCQVIKTLDLWSETCDSNRNMSYEHLTYRWRIHFLGEPIALCVLTSLSHPVLSPLPLKRNQAMPDQCRHLESVTGTTSSVTLPWHLFSCSLWNFSVFLLTICSAAIFPTGCRFFLFFPLHVIRLNPGILFFWPAIFSVFQI